MLEECSKVLNDYSGRTKYKYINKFLLMDENEIAFKKRFKKDVNEIKNDIKQIDDCFKKSSKTKNDSAVAYRGMDRDLGLKIGESTVLKNYLSTSMNKDIAQDFMKREYLERTFQLKNLCCLYRLHIAKDIPFINMGYYSKFGNNEQEVLLPRGLIMTYIGDEEDTHVLGQFKFKYTIKNVQITKLNEDIKTNVLEDMGEPITEEIRAIDKKETIEEKKILDKKERCPKGTRKNKQGICEPTKVDKLQIIKSPSLKLKSPSLKLNSPSLKLKSPSLKLNSPSLKLKSPSLKLKSPSLKLDTPTHSLKIEKKKRCPKGTHKNKQGECVKV
jgi:hypothetical protein